MHLGKEKPVQMKFKVIIPLVAIAVLAFSMISYVSAAGISASLTVQQGGVDATSAIKGTTVQVVSSFTVSPSASGTGTVSYRYSSDGVTYDPKTTITTYSNWDGTEQSVDFTLTNEGSYVFFLTVDSGFNSATTSYPSTGTFSSEPPPSVLPEASPFVALILCFVAMALFIGVTKRRSSKAA